MISLKLLPGTLIRYRRTLTARRALNAARVVTSYGLSRIARRDIRLGKPIVLSGPVLGALFYQSVVVAFFAYLLWFWMIHTYPVGRLVSFLFLVPLFGVMLSGVILGDPMPVQLWIGLGCVAAGIYLVNRPQRMSGR